MKRTLFAIIILLISAHCLAWDSNEIGSALKVSMINNPEKVWPGYSWSEVQVLLVDRSSRTAHVWNRENRGETKEIDYDWVPEKFRVRGCRFGEWDWKKTVAVTLDEPGYTSGQITELVCRAGFQNIVQPGWKRNGREVGGDWRPRYLRRMVMKSLYSALVYSNQYSLRKAVFWHNAYSTKFPDDCSSVRSSDILEGSAEFAGIFGAALGLSGAGASTARLYEKVRSLIKSAWKEKYDNPGYYAAPSLAESCAIGAMAGIMLDKMGATSWKEDVTEDRLAPMEILARYVKPLFAEDDIEEVNRAKKLY